MSLKKANKVEILCIGTELLLGNILNGNAKWLAEELALLGLPHFRQSIVGDNANSIELIIKEASKRCNILIITGGLGPTPDDITTEAIASTFKKSLIEFEEVLYEIKDKFKNVASNIPKSNYKQSLFPKEAKIIRNLSGTAPGMIWTPIDNFTIITLPGVPSEMKQMWSDSVKRWFSENIYTEEKFTSKNLRFAGISESLLAEKLEDLLENSNPTVAPYASLTEVKLRITARAKTNAEAEKLIKPIEEEIVRRTGIKCFSSDEQNLAHKVINLLKQRKETLSVAESCTGGKLGGYLTSIPGVSSVFLGGVIAYSNYAKEKILGVKKNDLVKNGAVSFEVVKSMAEGIKKELSSDWGIAISGIAGPDGGTNEKPIGSVQIGITGPGFLKVIPINFASYRTRIEIQELSVVRALDELRIILLNQS